MDNLTHSLVGLALAKAGLEKLSPGATTLCVLAANSPDADLVALVFGRWTYLQQHRGISHSILGVSILALALPLAFYLGDWLLAAKRNRERTIKLPALLLVSAIATASHPLMDWTNNYGVRFLLPWNPKWFYGDFVFIIDPFIWLILGSAGFLLTAKTRKQRVVWAVICVVTSLLVLRGPSGPRLALDEIVIRLVWVATLIVVVSLYRRNLGQRAGAKLAIAALIIVTAYFGGLAATHLEALRQAKSYSSTIATANGEQVVRVVAMPTVANPTRWVCAMETDRATYRFEFSLLRQLSPETSIRYQKPAGMQSQAVEEARRDSRAEVFLGFARFPVVRVVGEDCATQTLVQFADLRYTEPGRGRGTFSLDVPIDCPAGDNPDR
jgi:inner membrane protein